MDKTIVWRRAVSLAVPLSIIVAAACSHNGEAPIPRLEPQLPSYFDPCKDIPRELEQAQHFGSSYPEQEHAMDDQARAVGCSFLRSSDVSELGSNVIIEVTNMSADYYRDVYSKKVNKHLPDARMIKIGPRDAAVQESVEYRSCDILLDIPDGGLYLVGDTSKNGGCKSTIDLAEQLERVISSRH